MNNDIFDSKANRKIHFEELSELMPYKDKIIWAKKKIKEFLNYIQDYNVANESSPYKEITISFSGGKDSTVLLDLVLKVHKEIKCEIPLQPCYAAEITFPSTYKFIRDIIAKYQTIYPALRDALIIQSKLPWIDILTTKGYPIFSKQVSVLINRAINAKTKNSLTRWFFGIDLEHTNTSKYKLAKSRLFLLDKNLRTSWPGNISAEAKAYFKMYNAYYFFSEKCCDNVKGGLKHDKRPSFIGTMASESTMRKKSWIDNGCNIFNKNRPSSRPLSLWNSNDVWKYIKENDIDVNPAYGYDSSLDLNSQNLRFNRLGCSSCPFGSSIEQRFIELRQKHSPIDSKNNLQNRFEILKDLYPNIYKSQIIMTGMYKVVIDMGIPIHNDKLYMELFDLRRQQITEWYEPQNFRLNILRVLSQLENYKDYKHKGHDYIWEYNIHEVNEAMDYFNFEHCTVKEFNSIRVKTAEDTNDKTFIKNT